MKWDAQFFQTPTGQLLVVGMLAAIAVGVVGWQRTHRKPTALPESKSTAPAALPRVFQRIGARFETPATLPPPASAPVPADHAVPPIPKVLPLGVVAARVGSEAAGPVSFAPYGRMIPCETVVTLESNRLETPVIGLVTEDVWENGVLVIPAGAEVHGRASLDRTRERIAVEGRWIIVWRAHQREHATELRIDGVALDRTADHSAASLKDSDGSAGLRGEVLRTDDWREVKLFAATFLSTATSALQDTRASAGVLGETSIPAATARNATLAGTGAVLREYAQQLRDAIARDGFYVRVPAGKTFYLYVTQTLGASRVAASASANGSKPASP